GPVHVRDHRQNADEEEHAVADAGRLVRRGGGGAVGGHGRWCRGGRPSRANSTGTWTTWQPARTRWLLPRRLGLRNQCRLRRFITVDLNGRPVLSDRERLVAGLPRQVASTEGPLLAAAFEDVDRL